MKRAPKLYEKELYSVWQNKVNDKKLSTLSGSDIQIIDIGEFNEDSSGPDFLNARIKIGNITYVGDVEIDGEYNDWKHHGHNIDRKYNKVILHVCFKNKYHQNYVYTKEGRKIPSLCLSDYLNEEEVQKISKHFEEKLSELSYKLKCVEQLNDLPHYQRKKIIMRLGVKRFEKKCLRMYSRLKELKYIKELTIGEPTIGYDLSEEFQNRKFNPQDFNDKRLWQQLLYEFLFEALGYSKNKNAMLKLSRLVNFDFIDKLGHDGELKDRLHSAFYYIGGLVPDNLNGENKYETIIKDNWENIKRIYDGMVMDETEWHFFKLRPQNFPTIRIAGGIELLYKILNEDFVPTLINKFTELRKPSILIGVLRSMFITKSFGYWQHHYVFCKKSSAPIKYYIGSSRADEIMINVVLPFLSLYFEIFGKTELSKKVIQIFNSYSQRSTNKIVQDLAENLDMNSMTSKTVITQGLIELFRNYCSKNKCLECDFGQQVFN
ncbi:MAG: DUF2851 family protein [Ignavibacteria bacterium]|nr:MAG: DUF2851 family protein [Ignavibacteria bacterium]